MPDVNRDVGAARLLLVARRVPTIVALADQLTEDDQDTLFQVGIDISLRGISALARAEP